ncbi:MAG: hypothetical protein JWN99_1599 [Ilumatobacteraceae bacterium]|nr:hypothetical protein [Ilumatobacteraceae bacterium]
MSNIRRVVTSTDLSGSSMVASDGPPAIAMSVGGPTLAVLWEAITPLDYAAMGGDPDEGFTPLPQPGLTRFLQLVLPGRQDGDDPTRLDLPVGRSDTLDLAYVASGEVDLILDSGTVRLSAGDHLVMQGDAHGWRNAGPDECVLIAVMMGAPQRD